MTAKQTQKAPESTETLPAVQTPDDTPAPLNASEAAKRPCRGCAERAAIHDSDLAGLSDRVDDIEVQAFGWAGFAIGVALAAATMAVWALLKVSAISREGDE